MPKLDFEKLTPSNQAVQDLRELMELTVSRTRIWHVS